MSLDLQPVLLHQGKVRDVYEWGNDLLLVASDRVSAFDVILPTSIPLKGVILTQLSRFWFDFFKESVPHHIIGFNLPDGLDKSEWNMRTTWCRKAEVIPLECVVRGYLFGSAWNDYKATGSVQGHSLPTGLRQAQRLPEPIFTPTTKEKSGHDRSLTQGEAEIHVGKEAYSELKRLSLDIYKRAHAYALTHGIIIADTKFEFGRIDGRICLIDELLTPDSSRFWAEENYQVNFQAGEEIPSYDKQIVRNYLLSLNDWNRTPPGPPLPSHIVEKAAQKYHEVYERLTGKNLLEFFSKLK